MINKDIKNNITKEDDCKKEKIVIKTIQMNDPAASRRVSKSE